MEIADMAHLYGNMPIKTEFLILSELKITNDYLETLIGMFAKAFPDSISQESDAQFRAAKAKREPIGFKK